jgi:hypothetical protein
VEQLLGSIAIATNLTTVPKKRKGWTVPTLKFLQRCKNVLA